MQPLITYQRDELSQYRLILDLPAAVKKRFITARTKFDAFFRGMNLSGGQPFIGLAHFWGYETEETNWFGELHKVALGMMPFKIQLKNFTLLNGEEISIEISEKNGVQSLIKKLSGVQQYWREGRLNPEPRITLARGLYHWQIQRCWPYFEKQAFRSSFVINRMLLLKQMPGFRSWQIERSLLFENQLIQG